MSKFEFKSVFRTVDGVFRSAEKVMKEAEKTVEAGMKSAEKAMDETFKAVDESMKAASKAMDSAFEGSSFDMSTLQNDHMNIKVTGKTVVINGDVEKIALNGVVVHPKA
jgi:hypothetical protein